METNKVKNWITVIFLGALGSGLWSIAGEPTAGFLYNTAISIGGWVEQLYGNYMNSGIGNGGWNDRGSTLFIMFFVWGFAIFSSRKLVELSGSKRLDLATTLLLFLFAFATTAKAMYAHKVALYFSKNIEILAPQIEHQDVLEVRSLYRQIDDLASYKRAELKLFLLSEKADFKIETFSL